ncbi:MAG: DNA alkylation repair protein [Prevotella sp.]|nr:DNA alkylation repair protein [Staphylococcus sp.]MCM1350527.1 DNA alkylation repair protein [Prevotella sp.]
MSNRIEEFQELKNDMHKAFVEKLTPGHIPSLGIKIPIIKRFAKQVQPTYEILETIPLNEYIEQDILYGFLLNRLGKVKDEQYYCYMEKYVSSMSNWMTVDTFVSNTTFKNNELNILYSYIQKWLKSKEEFVVRTAVVMMKKYFITQKHFDEIFDLLTTISYGPYYVDMAVAWLLCSMACLDFNHIYTHLSDIQKWSEFVCKKAIQKMRESYLIAKEQKEKLLSVS